MSEWPSATLEEIASPGRYSVVGGPFGSALGRKDYVDAGVPVIRGAQLGGPGWFSHDDLVYVTDDKADRHQGNLAYPGDVLVTQRGTVGQVGLIPVDAPFERYLLSQSQMKLTVDPSRANARFVYYWLLSPEAQHAMVGSTISAGVPHINLATFKGMNLPLPSLPEQEHIAEILGAIDELIENCRRRVEVLEEMAKAIYREWFVHFRYPGHEDATFVDSPLGPIPAGWEVRPFSDIATFVNGFAFKPDHWSDSGRPIIKIKQLKQGVGPDTPRCEEVEIDRKYWVEPGDLLFSWSADLDVYRWAEEPGLLNQHLFTVRPGGDLTLAFLFHALDVAMPQFWDRAQGTTMRHIKRSALTEVSTAVPAPQVVASFTAVVEPMAQEVIALLGAARELRALRDLLLPKLVTGQIDVSSLDLDLVEAAG